MSQECEKRKLFLFELKTVPISWIITVCDVRHEMSGFWWKQYKLLFMQCIDNTPGITSMEYSQQTVH